MQTETCHICHDERPDEVIGLLEVPIPGSPVGLAIRYCTDRERCVAGARAYTRVPGYARHGVETVPGRN